MSRTVRIEPEAADEIREGYAWYETRQSGLGSVFAEAVDEAIARIVELPDASTPVPGVPSHIPARRVFVKRFPYTVIFMSIGDMDDELVILAVAHMKRRPGYWHWRALR